MEFRFSRNPFKMILNNLLKVQTKLTRVNEMPQKKKRKKIGTRRKNVNVYFVIVVVVVVWISMPLSVC